jgi:hypothetical protein
MILLLAEAGTEPIGQAIVGALTKEYSLPCWPEVIPAGSVWERNVEWDDLLFVVYRSDTLTDSSLQYIKAYRDAHASGGAIIPVSVDAAVKTPPEPIAGIRAAEYDGTPEAMADIVKVAGIFLGLGLRPGSQRIFVAYRATDGKEIAEDLHARLSTAGFHPWLDVADDSAGAGDDIQDRIRRHVQEAGLILVVDTPDAPDSKWLALEVEIATAQLIPILPVVAGGERSPRLVLLQSLRRCAVVKREGADRRPLGAEDWGIVSREVEELFLTVYRRRLRILTRAREIFKGAGFMWATIDEPRRMYMAERRNLAMPGTVVLSHCSVHDVTYLPMLRAYAQYVEELPEVASINYKMCVYDRDKVLSEAEYEAIDKSLNGIHFILAHYNELGILIRSNFTQLRLSSNEAR